MAITVFIHEGIHMVRQDEYLGRGGEHDTDPTGIMTRNYHGQGQPTPELTQHDKDFICSDK